MAVSDPTLLALDFDGVLCDGLKEYFQTAWQAYRNLWSVENPAPPDEIAESFYRLRPVVETGWEMPVLIRAILLQIPEIKILQDWPTIAQQILQTDQIEPPKLSAEVDGVRDRWIAADVGSWLAEQQFYPGVTDRLIAALTSSVTTVIISTKEGRFIQELLQQQGVPLENLQIFGKETKRPKSEILRELLAQHGPDSRIWFVEDRLKTLQTVGQQPDLQSVRLFLADWGYNTSAERAVIAEDPLIRLLSLERFRQEFAAWLV